MKGCYPMDSFRNKLSQFMQGRYGFDRLSRLLVLISLVFWALCFLSRLTPWHWLGTVFSVLNTVMYLIALYRILSRDIAARTLENERYLQFCSRALPTFYRIKAGFSDRSHAYRSCPACGALLRLKKVKGKHTTQCPKCGKKFKVKIVFGANTAQSNGKGNQRQP